MDELDRTLIHLFSDEPRVGVLEASRRLGVARGTVQSRLDRLVSRGVIRGWGPELDPAAMGYPVTAFLTLEIRQRSGPDGPDGPDRPEGPDGSGGSTPARGGHDAVAAHLARIPEVLEVVTITGAGDLWCRVVARSNSDLQRVIDEALADPGIVRSSTVIALATQVPYRTRPLLG
jgi:DNA-binding Lrp family transcriptional regulator